VPLPHNWRGNDTEDPPRHAAWLNELETLVVGTGGPGFWNIAKPPYNVVADSFYQDGVISSSTTLTSATAGFTALDVGKQILIECGGTTILPLPTSIASVTNPTTVVLAAATSRTRTNTRFYISRGGDQSATIQTAINDASAAGGGVVYCPGPGYLTTGLVLKNRVVLKGAGMRSTMFHTALNTMTGPVIRNDYVVDNTANLVAVKDLAIDGGGDYQSNVNSALGAQYTAGDGTITLVAGQVAALGILPAGTVLIGTNRLRYASITGDVLQNVIGGVEGTTDATAINGSGVKINQQHGIFFMTQPVNGTPLYAEGADTHDRVENVNVRYARSYGIYMDGMSETRLNNVWATNNEEVGIRPSWDTWLDNCTCNSNGRAGYYVFGSSGQANNCKSFSNGSVTPTQGHGFLFEGPTTLEEGCKTWTNLNAQDNFGHGIYLRNAQRMIVQGTSSTNSNSGAGNFTGVCIDGCTNGLVDVVCCDRTVTTVYQQNALLLQETGGIQITGMQIRISHGQVTGAGAPGPAIKASSVWTGGIDLHINGMGGTLAPVFSATPIFDPYLATTHIMGVLTAGTVIGVPANAHRGCPLVVVLQQDGTGNRTIGWNAIFKNTPATVLTANLYTIGRFINDGTNWVGV
jgi:hypothetical protein